MQPVWTGLPAHRPRTEHSGPRSEGRSICHPCESDSVCDTGGLEVMGYCLLRPCIGRMYPENIKVVSQFNINILVSGLHGNACGTNGLG